MNTNRRPPLRPTACLAIWLLAAACGAQPLAPTLTPIPSLTLQPDRAGVIPTRVPSGLAATTVIPVDAGPLPLDLAVIDSENVDRLVRIKELTAPGPRTWTSGVSLTFLAPHEHSLAAHFDNGQTILWDVATGAVRHEDRYPSDGDRFVENPPLALSPAYQGYLATSALGADGTEPRSGRSVVVRYPDESTDGFLLPAAGPWPEDTARVMSLAFSPDGRLLAVGIGGREGGVVQFWDISDSNDRNVTHEVTFDDEVTALRFTPDGTALIAAVGSALVSLDPNQGIQLLSWPYEFLIDGYAAGPSGETMAVWAHDRAVLESPLLAAPLETPAAREIRRVAFTPDEQLALIADGAELHIWDLSSGVELASHSNDLPYYPFLDVAVSENGRLVATVDQSSRVSLWGVPRGLRRLEAQTYMEPSNAASLQRAATLYLPGARQAWVSPASEWLAVGSEQGVYLVKLPSLGLRTLLRQTSSGYSAFDASFDGSRLAWVVDQDTVKVWDFQFDSLIGEIEVPGGECCAQVLLAPDGEWMVTLSGSTARLWDLSSETELYSRQDVQRVDVSPDGLRLAFESAVELRVSIWDRLTGVDVRQLTGFETAAPVYGTKFSPGWTWMYWASRASMQFSEVESGALGHFVPFSWGELSPREDRIALVEDGWIYQTVGQAIVVDPASGETLSVLDHHEDAIIRAVAFSPDGELIATALGRTIKVWDALSGAELATLSPASGSVHDLLFSPDGRILLSLAEGDLVELWTVSAEPEPAPGLISIGNAASVVPLDSLQLGQTATDAVFSPDNNTVAVSTASGAIWFWDVASGQSIEGKSQHTDWIYRLAYDPAGTSLVSVSKDGTLRYRGGPESFDVRTGQLQGELSALAFLPDGETVATSGQDGTLRLWNLTETRPTLTTAAHQAWVWDVAVSPAVNLLATASADRTIRLWDVAVDSTGDRLVRTLTGHTAAVWGVDFAPDGRTLASASWDETVRLWDVSHGEQLAVLEGHSDWVYDVAYSPDGSLLASSSADGTVRLWEAATGEPLATLEGSGGRIWSVDFSPDGHFLVSAPDTGEVVLWGVAP